MAITAPPPQYAEDITTVAEAGFHWPSISLRDCGGAGAKSREVTLSECGFSRNWASDFTRRDAATRTHETLLRNKGRGVQLWRSLYPIPLIVLGGSVWRRQNAPSPLSE